MKYTLLFLLSACMPRPAIVEPVEVKVPLAVSCEVQAVPEPDWNVPHLAANADFTTRLTAEIADLYLSKGYIEELQAALSACG